MLADSAKKIQVKCLIKYMNFSSAFFWTLANIRTFRQYSREEVINQRRECNVQQVSSIPYHCRAGKKIANMCVWMNWESAWYFGCMELFFKSHCSDWLCPKLKKCSVAHLALHYATYRAPLFQSLMVSYTYRVFLFWVKGFGIFSLIWCTAVQVICWWFNSSVCLHANMSQGLILNSICACVFVIVDCY